MLRNYWDICQNSLRAQDYGEHTIHEQASGENRSSWVGLRWVNPIDLKNMKVMPYCLYSIELG
jgi:hypothetical protein